MMKVYEYISKKIKENGVTNVFGVPGSYIMPIWQNIDIPITLCTHEGDASYIASAYSKRAQELSVVLVTSSPGVSNAISGIASAYRDSVPLLIISGTTSISCQGLGAFQEESDYDRAFCSVEITKPIVKKNYIIKDVNDVEKVFNEALGLTTIGRPGPVHISIPVDIQNMEMELNTVNIYDKSAAIKNLLPAFKIEVSTPLIIIGGGCYKREDVASINRFSNKIAAPIICSMKGMSYIEDNSFSIGCVGMGANEENIDFIKKYKPQNIFCFGTSLSKKDFESIYEELQDANLYIFSLEDNYSYKFTKYNYCKTQSIKFVVDYLCKNVLSANDKTIYQLRDDIIELKKIRELKLKERIKKSGLMAQSIYYIMRNVDMNTIVSADAGNHYLDAINCFTPRNYGTFYIDAGLAAMGNGICTSIGVAIGELDKHHICITGDGCMLMNGTSIYTAKKLNLPIVFVVFNNCSLGRVRIGQMKEKKFIGSDIFGCDFKRFGESMNIDSYQVENLSQLKQVFDLIKNKKETILIEVICSHNEIPLGLKG